AVGVIPEPAEPSLAAFLDPRTPHRAHQLLEGIHLAGDDLVDLMKEDHARDDRTRRTSGSRRGRARGARDAARHVPVPIDLVLADDIETFRRSFRPFLDDVESG